MTWNIQFDTEHKIMDYFDSCANYKEQQEYIINLIKHYTQPQYKCLEIGMGCIKYGDNWQVLDPYDKREGIDFRFGLEDVLLDHYDLFYSFDFIKATAVFEHVKNPFDCAKSIAALLKRGGVFYGDFPFAFPYHPFKGYKESEHGILQNIDQKQLNNDEMHGGDYWRYTPDSIRLLFPDGMFKIIKLEKTKAGSFIYIGEKI